MSGCVLVIVTKGFHSICLDRTLVTTSEVSEGDENDILNQFTALFLLDLLFCTESIRLRIQILGLSHIE